MNTAKVYQDSDGNACSITQMVKREPKWAASRIQEGERAIELLGKLNQAKPIEDWHEDDGPVLWWTYPVVEPPYCGTPLDSDFPGGHTHWSPILVPTHFQYIVDDGAETA